MNEQIAIHCLKSEIMLENCEECPKYGETGTDHCQEDAIRLAIEALEKQIPKKVEDFMERTEEFGGFYKLDFMCPTCNEATICQPYRPKYCKHCGQKLDWGD